MGVKINSPSGIVKIASGILVPYRLFFYIAWFWTVVQLHQGAICIDGRITRFAHVLAFAHEHESLDSHMYSCHVLAFVHDKQSKTHSQFRPGAAKLYCCTAPKNTTKIIIIIIFLNIRRTAKIGPLNKDKRSLRLCSTRLPQHNAFSDTGQKVLAAQGWFSIFSFITFCWPRFVGLLK